MAEPIGLTAVIPTLNRPEHVIRTATELLAQKYPLLEILIVDQSDENESAIVRKFAADEPAITYRHVRFRSLPTARNYAFRHARHEAILFLDDDIHCDPALLREHARCLQLPRVGIIAGAVDEAAHAGRTPPAEPTGRFDPLTGIPARGFHATGEFDVGHAPGGNFSVWREVFRKCGGIDETLNVGAALYEETDFCRRAVAAGYRVLFCGSARMLHLAVPRGGCRVHVVRDYAWGLSHNRAIIIRRHVRWFYRPIAFGRLAITAMSLSIRNHDLSVFLAFVRGAACGYSKATDPVRDGSSE